MRTSLTRMLVGACAVAVSIAAAAPASAQITGLSIGRNGGPVLYQPTGQITLTASIVTGTNVEYQFWSHVKPSDPEGPGVWTLACDYSTTASCQLNGGADLTTRGKYTFTVYARTVGSVAAYEAYSIPNRADVIPATVPSGSYPEDWVGYGRTRVFFQWVAPQDTTDLVGYELLVKNKDLDTNQTFTPGNVLAFNVDLQPGYSYFWWLRTILGGGGNGPYSTEKSFAITVARPIAPAQSALVPCCLADFSWTPVTPGTGYELTLFNVTTGMISNTFSISGPYNTTQTMVPLVADNDYRWWVKATGLETANSTPISFFAGPTPIGIKNVSNPASPFPNGTPYAVTWTSRSVGAGAVAEIWYYRGSQSAGGSNWTLLAGPIGVDANADTFTITIPPFAEYDARLWVGGCQPSQVSGGRCLVYPWGGAISSSFVVN